jgi:hypothetical protein
VFQFVATERHSQSAAMVVHPAVEQPVQSVSQVVGGTKDSRKGPPPMTSRGANLNFLNFLGFGFGCSQ